MGRAGNPEQWNPHGSLLFGFPLKYPMQHNCLEIVRTDASFLVKEVFFTPDATAQRLSNLCLEPERSKTNPKNHRLQLVQHSVPGPMRSGEALNACRSEGTWDLGQEVAVCCNSFDPYGLAFRSVRPTHPHAQTHRHMSGGFMKDSLVGS